MIGKPSLLWWFVCPVLVWSFCPKKQQVQEPPEFELKNGKLTMVELFDLAPKAFSRIDHTYGRCLRNSIKYQAGYLRFVIACNAALPAEEEVIFWDTSDVDVDLRLHKKGSTVVGYDLYLCKLQDQASGVVIVNNPRHSLAQFGNARRIFYDYDCSCNYTIGITIGFTDRLKAIQAVKEQEQPREDEGLPKHYKIIVGSVMLIVILMLCIACSHF